MTRRASDNNEMNTYELKYENVALWNDYTCTLTDEEMNNDEMSND